MGRRHDERGYAAVLTAVFVAFVMLPCCAIAVDVARMYLEIQRVQNAADAAALAAVTYLPDDFNAATATAKAVTRKNGYPDQGDVDVAVALGAKPTQLKVTVRSTITNSFAAAFGMESATVERSATADYNAPAPMGSPCNSYGNVPPPGAAETTAPTTAVEAAQGGATCTDKPDFWAAIAGPATVKSQGDAIMTRQCGASTNAGCDGTTNREFDPTGYFYSVRVAPEAVGTPVTLQIFDPAHFSVGDLCGSGPNVVDSATTPLRDPMNDYTADGTIRYAKDAGSFCTGDVGSGVITSFGLRKPTETYRPTNGAPITSCVKQFPSYAADAATTKTLNQRRLDGTANPSYRPNVAKVFRQWVDLCTFTPTEAGVHYLQVRTNVKLGGTKSLVPGSTSSGNEGIWTGNQQVFSQAGDDTSVGGSGNNRFTLRAVGTGAKHVSVSGTEEMGVYANYPATGSTVQTRFNLVRVVPAASTKTLIITIFDIGDGGSNGTLKVLPPTETPITLTGCTGSGPKSGALTDCGVTGIKSGSPWEAQTQTIRVPIPTDYTCNVTEFGGCWFRLAVNFPNSLTDTTTWTARVEGDPVRLIE